MEIRRIQMTGGSSYIVTLPKEWVKTTNIQKNDPIGLIQQPDGTLLITPKMNKEQTQRLKEFEISESTDQNDLFRSLIGAYISGYNSIRIKSKGRMPSKVRITVRNFTQTTIGQEVVEETDNSILLKDLLNPTEMPFNRTIKRMHIMVKGMYDDTIYALKNKDKQIIDDILTRDNEIDRLHWLIARQHHIILRNINFAEKMGTTMSYSTTSYFISRILERIGDHTIKIARNIQSLIDTKIDKKIISSIHESGDLSIELLNQSLGAFFKKDLEQANTTIKSLKKIEKRCDEINVMSSTLDPSLTMHISNIVESIRRIGEYSSDISEGVINHLVGEE